MAALEGMEGGQGGAFGPDQQAAQHHHAQHQAEECPDQLDPQPAKVAGVQRAHGLGDELQRRAVGQQVRNRHFAGVGVDLCGLEHQRVPAPPADLQMAVGIEWQEHEAGLQPRNPLAGDFDRVVQGNHRRRHAGGGRRHVLPGDHRHDGFAGDGNLVIPQDRLNQEPGAGDGNDRDEPDRPDTAQAMEVAPEDSRAMADAQGRAQKALPEALVHHQPGDQRRQQRQAERGDQVPAPTEPIGEWHQPPAVQGAGELFEVERRADALDRPGVRVDIDLHRAPVGVAEGDTQGEVRLVRADDGLHDHQGLCAFDGVDHLVIAQRFGVVRRLAGADFRVGQPDDFLADHGQGAGDADDQYKKPDG